LKVIWLMVLLLLPIIYATTPNECLRVQLTNNIPCNIVSAYRPAGGCTGSATIYYENGTYIQDVTWSEQPPFCSAIFNISSPTGSYIYNSSIDDGIITLEQEDNMLAVILSFMFIISMFAVMGLPHKNGVLKFFSYGIALIEFMLMVMVIWINEAGNSIVALLRINAISVLLIGGIIGLFSLYVFSFKIAKADEDAIGEDAYTKFVNR